MNTYSSVDGVNILHVKSHLQKYRLVKDLPPSPVAKQQQSKQCSLELPSLNVETGLQITETLRLQLEVQKQLHEQLEIQRDLQKKIEDHGRYLERMYSKTEEATRSCHKNSDEPSPGPQEQEQRKHHQTCDDQIHQASGTTTSTADSFQPPLKKLKPSQEQEELQPVGDEDVDFSELWKVYGMAALAPSSGSIAVAPRSRAAHFAQQSPASRRILALSDQWQKLNKVVLAYSGGLDTSVIVPWLRENYGCVCFTADVGQGLGELEWLEAKAKASGASQLIIKDLKEEFVKDFIFPCLRAGAVYERKYLLGTSMARPAMVDAAKEVGADAVSHGCTGKGNDQVRFELTFFALNPKLAVVAPWREWDIKGREDAIEYAKKHNVPVPVTKKSIYSRDRNLWHIRHEGDILEDPANEPKEDMFVMTTNPEKAPDTPENLFVPEPRSVRDARWNHPEPSSAGAESLALDRETMQMKDTMALKYAELVYAGRWFDPLRESLDAFMEKVTETTSGSVKQKLFKGSAVVASRTSPFSLYRQDISSFEEGSGIYNQGDAAGFIRLYGLPTRVRAMLLEK
ncbi:hypothetical protein SELMODRAFT_405683 [Selaginella moellendorffii]|uniref:argininosuccinate synthase n=1 Tax=Selaginella moellendorffii TaxID=88036 RepID=D8QZD4_SELML|nr:hypothetical protein SELMODRAFT_405683 [Selaginella moellendorffii]